MMPVIPLTVPILGLFWKLSSFLILRAENRHDRPLNLLPDRSEGAAAATAEALPARRRCSAPPVLAAKKLNLRKLLLTGAAIAALAGAAWYGWDYWTVGRFWCRPMMPM